MMTRFFRPDDRRSPGNASPFDLIEGILQSDLDAADNPLDGATTANVRVLKWDTGDVFYQTELEDTVTNRSIDLSVEAGTYIIAARMNGEWRIIWADCGPGDISSESTSAGVVIVVSGQGGGTYGGNAVFGFGGGYGGW